MRERPALAMSGQEVNSSGKTVIYFHTLTGMLQEVLNSQANLQF